VNRGERRARTERKVTRRWKEWERVVLEERRRRSPALNISISDRAAPTPGVAKKRSLFDCGRPQCEVCRPGPPRPRPEWDGQ